jgi:hypothetical protein
LGVSSSDDDAPLWSASHAWSSRKSEDLRVSEVEAAMQGDVETCHQDRRWRNKVKGNERDELVGYQERR